MNTKEPLYIKGLREHIDKKFKDVDNKIETSINELAISTANAFSKMATKDDIRNMATKDDIRNMATKDDLKDLVTKSDFNYEISEIKRTMATKEDTDKILKHIGAYEVRAQNIEQILLQDHKPRIAESEKAVF